MHIVTRFAAALFFVMTSVAWGLAFADRDATCTPSRADMLGPFYVPNAPERATTGRGLTIEGVVRGTPACAPLRGATLEWWSANSHGDYDDAHRATQITDGEGRYRYETDVPGRYPGRPPHVHLRVSAAGYKTLVTQVYPKPGATKLGIDLVLGKE
jgi:protocatechuate 3,4-dioxygenase beta subunit